MAEQAALAEALQERYWRARCGEPCPPNVPGGGYPIRCRRDLSHDDGHIGLRGETAVRWPGEGNAASAQTGPGIRCWCVPGHRWLLDAQCQCGEHFAEWRHWSEHVKSKRREIQ